MSTSVPVITVDGPAGSGKGTVAGGVAAHLGWRLLDSGALYRVVGLMATRRGIDWAREAALAVLAGELDIAFADGAVHVDGANETRAIRALAVDAPASRVAAVPAVRAALLDVQRGFRVPPGLVADGRDMGTVVFADARLKIFLTATADARAERRLKQLRARSEEGAGASRAALRTAIHERDERDSRRAVAPLVAAPDAVVIDSTTISAAAVIDRVLALATQRGLAPAG